jgi:hypothetical protein
MTTFAGTGTTGFSLTFHGPRFRILAFERDSHGMYDEDEQMQDGS